MLEEYMNKQKAAHDMSGYKFELEVPENYAGSGQHIGRVDIRILLSHFLQLFFVCDNISMSAFHLT